MRLVIQRSLGSRLTVGGELVSEAGSGLMILVGVETGDSRADADWLAEKALGLRIFNDAAGVMNRSVLEAGGEVMGVDAQGAPPELYPRGGSRRGEAAVRIFLLPS